MVAARDLRANESLRCVQCGKPATEILIASGERDQPLCAEHYRTALRAWLARQHAAYRQRLAARAVKSTQ
jgi:hypothetical protein